MNLIEKMIRGFYVDLRSIYLFRIVLGAITAFYTVYVLFYSNLFLASNGILPLESIYRFYLQPPIFLLSDSLAYQQCILLFMIGLSIVQILSVYPRIAGLFLYYLLLCLLYRIQPFINSGLKLLLYLQLFSSFLPKTKSLIEFCRHDLHKNYRIVTVGTVLLVLQAPIMFFISAIFKSQSASWRSGIAVYQALQLDMYTHDFSFLFRDLPTGLYQFLTYTTLLVEFAAPVLLLLGGFSDKARLLAWATLSLFAIVFTLLLRLGIFPLVVFCALVPLFPTLGFTMLGSKQKETIAVKQNFRGLLNIFAGVVICVVIYGNLHKTFSKTFPISQQVKKYIYLPTLLQQNWNVYGQEKWRSTSVSLIASTTKGTKGNLWEWWSAGISEDKIRMFPASMHYYRNSFHLIGLNDFLYFHGNREYENNRLGRLSNYLCRKYNSSHQNNKIENVQVWSSKREVLNFHEIYFNTPSLIRSVDCE